MTFEEYDARRNKYFRIIYSDGSALIVREANKRDARQHGKESARHDFPWKNIKVSEVQEITKADFKAITDQTVNAFYAAMNIKNTRKEGK